MADKNINDRRVLSEAAELLTKAAALLTETGNGQNSSNTNVVQNINNVAQRQACLSDTNVAQRQSPLQGDRTTNNSANSTPNIAQSGRVGALATPSSSWEDRAVQNFRNLFGGLPSKTTQQSAGGRQKPGNLGAKKCFNPKTGAYFWKRETWTHRFVCLSQRDQIVTPTRDEKEALRVAGLGEKKIVLNKELCASDVISELIKAYPKLSECSGFELLRSGNRLWDLILITPPPGGYSVPFLKNCGIGQSIIYIRPIQTNLELDPVTVEEIDPELVS